MKNIFLILGFLFIVISVQAQQYVPFPKSGAAWLQTWVDGSSRPISGYTELIALEKDTTINSISYIMLSSVRRYDSNTPAGWVYGFYNAWRGAMREDSSKHIYFYNLSENKEYLLYNFNLKVGDTLPKGINNEYGNIFISSIDSILLNGAYHKRFGLTRPNSGLNNPYVFIIEGVGSTFGLISELMQPFEQVHTLRCFTKGIEQVYPEFSANCIFYLGYNENFEDKTKLNIFPNPSTGQLTIQTQSIFSDSYICVRDVLGRIVHQEKLQFPNQNINISSQPKGLYFVELYFNGEKSVQKVILQ